jgi:hypothetical protein
MSLVAVVEAVGAVGNWDLPVVHTSTAFPADVGE